MAETFWTFEQAAEWVRAHRPCGPRDAFGLLQAGIEDGRIPARYRRPDGRFFAIPSTEWQQGGWHGSEQDEHLRLGVGEYEIEAAAVQRLCTPHSASKKGRPQKSFVAELAVCGAVWLTEEGVPDTNVALAKALRERCDKRGWNYGDTQINKLAADLIAEYRAALALK